MERAFTSRWRRGRTGLLVKLNLVVGGAAALFAALNSASHPGVHGLWLPAMLGLATAFYFAPMLSRRPVMELTENGVWLDALGLIPWTRVAAVEGRHFLRQGRSGLEQLDLSLDRPIELALVARAPAPPWRDWQIRSWRVLGPERIRVVFGRLEDDPLEIRRAFDEFLTRPRPPQP